MFPLRDLFKDIPDVHIVDVGASPIEGQPVYQPILNQGGYRLTGFEPNPAMYQQLVSKPHPKWTFYPFAVGDGSVAELKICSAPGMTSLLEPDLELLKHFHQFAEWGRVIERQPLTTRRLDDIAELKDIDFLKLDVQGSELAVLQNATEKLRQVLVIHVETLFVPFYKNQPLFGDIDLCLRKAGFMFHRFGPMASRVFQPVLVNNDIYAGLSQVLWSDAVYVKSFMQFGQLSPAELLKTARILHDVYGSFDLANLALIHYDLQSGTNRQNAYLQRLTTAK